MKLRMREREPLPVKFDILRTFEHSTARTVRFEAGAC